MVSTFNYKALLAGLSVVILGSLAIFFCFSKSDRAGDVKVENTDQQKRIKAVSPQIRKQSAALESDSKEAVVKVQAKATVEPQQKKVDDFPNTNGWIVVEKEEPEIVFDSMVEQQMNWIFTTEPGDPPPPLLPIEKHEMKRLAEILISKLEIKKEDTEVAANCKETVNLAKKELAKFIREGGDPEEFLQHYWNLLDEANKKWEKATEQIRMARNMDDPEVVQKYIEKVNAELAEDGIKPAYVPASFRAKLPEIYKEEE